MADQHGSSNRCPDEDHAGCADSQCLCLCHAEALLRRMESEPWPPVRRWSIETDAHDPKVDRSRERDRRWGRDPTRDGRGRSL